MLGNIRVGFAFDMTISCWLTIFRASLVANEDAVSSGISYGLMKLRSLEMLAYITI